MRPSALVLTITSSIVLALSLHGCRGEEPRPATPERPRLGGTFRFALTEPRGLDPATYEDAYQWQLMDEIFEGLVAFDPDLNVVPALARTWTVSTDGLTYDFELRADARFHNGRAVRAEDVAYSFERAIRVPTGMAREYLTQVLGVNETTARSSASIPGIVVRGPLKLQLRLAHPYAPFLATLAIPPLRVVPREEVESRGTAFARHPIGSGPFRVADWTAENVLVLEPFVAYPTGRPYLDRIEVRFGSWSDEVALFQRGEIDRALIGRGDESRLPTGTPVVQRLELGTTCLGVNLAFPSFADPRVRRAAALALDRDAIAAATGRIAVPSRAVVPSGIPGGPPRAFAPDRDPEEARRLLAAAGHANGAGLPVIDFWANQGNPAMKGAAGVVTRNLEEVGFRIRERTAAWPDLLRFLDSRKAPLYMLTWVADTPDRDAYLGILFHSKGSNNYVHYADVAVDRLLDRARQEMDPLERMRLYGDVERRIGDANALLPLFGQANAVAVRAGLRGYTLDAFGNTKLRRLWWDGADDKIPTSRHP